MRSLLFLFPPSKKFMLIIFSLCVARISAAHGGVVINEIYYDHPGKDDGYEFIELINTGPDDLCMETLSLEFHNGAGSGWELLWRGSAFDTVRSRCLFVVGGEYVFPRADAVLRMGLQNGPDAVRITSEDNVLDLVGYGSLEDAEYVEGTSAGSASAGYSLCRTPDGRDTGNNQLDFHSMVPSPGRYNVPVNDVSLALAEGTREAAAVEAGTPVEIRFMLINNGTESVPAGAVTVQWRDSSQAGSYPLGEVENSAVIDSACSHEMAFLAGFPEGYHFLKLHAAYAADERPGNNHIGLVRRVGFPHVLISEIMSCPAEPCPQYVEIFNAGGAAYDINEHAIRDAAHSFSRLTSQECILQPDGYLVVTPDKRMLMSVFPALSSLQVLEIEGAWPHLNHSGSGAFADSIIICDPFGIPIESVAYPPQSSAQCGNSLERVDLFPSSRSPVWVLSRSAHGGSPGGRNETSIFTSPEKGTISVTPNPFSPIAGEKLLIVVDPPPAADRTSVTVFDVRGRIVRTVGSTTVHPYVFVWEGNRDGGGVVPSGLYVLACEMVSSDGRRLGVEKVVVGCGKKRR